MPHKEYVSIFQFFFGLDHRKSLLKGWKEKEMTGPIVLLSHLLISAFNYVHQGWIDRGNSKDKEKSWSFLSTHMLKKLEIYLFKGI